MSRRSFVETGMVQWRIVCTLVAGMVAFGVISLLTMPRQEFPDFTIRQGLVVGLMPGATSSEVEERLAKPVEEYLFGFKEIEKKKTYSVSTDGQVVVFVELRPQIKGPDAPAFWAKLRHGLNELRMAKLPSQVVALVGNNDFGDTSAVLFTVTADGRSPRDLAKYVETLQTNLRRIEATSKVQTFGAQEETIRVTLSRERLTRTGVRPPVVWAALHGLSVPPAPARLDTEQLEMPVHVQKVLRTESELGATILLSLPSGEHVRLKDVAEIKREYGHDDSYVRFNGKTAMVVSIEMQTGHDITRFGEEIDRALAHTRSELPPGVTIARVADQPLVVKRSVGHFLRDFGLAIASVILVTMLLLPLRVAAVAAISIPLCIAITLAVLNALGVQLQTVSLAGLVVVLGMVVDNAIVVIDDHVEKLDQGMDPWTAAWKSARELTVPVLTATVAIILSYVPMPLFLTGQSADFVSSLPITIGVALVTSMLIAVLLVPVMNWRFIRHGLHRAGGKRSILDRLQSAFDVALDIAFRFPRLTLLLGAATIVLALLIGARLPTQTFPKVDRNQFAVEVYLPPGRSLAQTDAVIRRLERELMADKRVVNVTSFIGQGSPRFHTLYAPHMPGRNYGQLIVNTLDNQATLNVLNDSERRLAGAFPEAKVRWKQLDMMSANPVEIRLSSDHIPTLKKLAAQLESYARTVPGVTWARNDYEEALRGIDVLPDADACTQLGVPPSLLQASMAMGSQGLAVGTIWEGDYPVRVLLKDEETNASTLEGLRQQYVSSALGALAIPLEQVASVRPSLYEGAIVRRNGVRTLTTHLDIARDALGSQVQKAMEDYIAKLPHPGVRIDYGGEREQSAEVFVPMGISMAVSIALIGIVLLFQFQRFRKVALVMLTMPLSLLGAFLGLVLTGYPFSLTGFMGVIGLLGIVVRNGVILVSYAEELRKEGMNAFDAALAAGKRRMRPICLTSLAAAIGTVPMILSRSTLWGPLGAVTCSGLLVAMVVTLIVLPVAYWRLMRTEDQRKAQTVSVPVVGVTVAALALTLTLPARAQESPLTLARAQELALHNNARTQQSEMELEASRETKKSVYTKYFPQVSASATALLAAKPLVKMNMSGGNLPVYDGNPANLASATQFAYMPPSSMEFAEHATVLSLSAVQPVYAGGRIRNGNRLADLGVQIAKDKSVLSRRDVVAQTEEKYWRLVTLSEKLNTITAYETMLEALDRQVKDGVAGGLLTRNDHLKVSLKRSEARADHHRLENGLHLATRDLRQHVGLHDGDNIALADGLAAPVDPTPLAREKDGATARRPELRLLDGALQAERLQTDLKRGEMLPSVAVGAALCRLDVSGMPGMTNALVFGTVSVPLSEIWGTSHATASQRHREAMAARKLEDTRELIGLEINKTWIDLQSAWDAANVAEEAVAQADVNLKEESDRYANGLVAFSDLLEAQVLRQQTLDHRLDARSEYWLKRSAYLRAVGSQEVMP
jgi:multidrug efflux pump subunit AcrB/outer membrane protein TolC